MDRQKSTHENAHSNFRKGMSDYHDGENVTDQLGNEDYHNSANLPDPYARGAEFDGREALGNDLTEDEMDNEENEFHGKENNDEQKETQRP